MMRGVLCLLCVWLYSIVVCVGVNADVDVFNGMFYIPSSGSRHGLQLDVEVLPCAINALETITITLPTQTINGQTNAILVGPPFKDRLISGSSVHGGVVSDGTSLLVSWDGVSNLTFGGFSLPSATGVVIPISSSDAPSSSSLWVNVNWYIPDHVWVDPTEPDFKDSDPTKLPLILTSFKQGISPRISLTADTFFQPNNKRDACL